MHSHAQFDFSLSEMMQIEYKSRETIQTLPMFEGGGGDHDLLHQRL